VVEFIPSCPDLTSLTGARHWWVLPRVNVWLSRALSCVALGQFLPVSSWFARVCGASCFPRFVFLRWFLF
jgi:hypothetical protein